MADTRHDVKWIDRGFEPTQPPNPAFPNGITLDMSGGATNVCVIDLAYPAPRCGNYAIRCRLCGLTALVSTAGRPDDPKQVTVACRWIERRAMH